MTIPEESSNEEMFAEEPPTLNPKYKSVMNLTSGDYMKPPLVSLLLNIFLTCSHIFNVFLSFFLLQIRLRSSDGVVFETTIRGINLSTLLRNLLAKYTLKELASMCLPFPNIHSNILAKVREYLHYHQYDTLDLNPASMRRQKLAMWDAMFVEMHVNLIFEILSTANYLQIPGLIKLCSDKINQKNLVKQ